MVGFLARQKQVWISAGLTLLLVVGMTVWAVKFRPYLMERKVGLVLETPPAQPILTPEPARVAVESADIPEIRQGVAEQRAEAETLIRQAESDFRTGQADAARDRLTRAVSLTADTQLLSIAYSNLAHILDGEGRYAQAVAYLQRALTFHRSFPDGYHNLGIVYLHMREFDKAQLSFQMAIREKPDFAASHAGLGEIHATLGRFPEAIQSFNESLRLREDPEVRLNLGLAFLHSGNHVQAIEHFSLVQASAPDPYLRYLALFNRAMAHEAKSRWEEAAADYRSALAISSKDVDATFNLGVVLEKSGKKEEGLAAFKRVIEMDPDNLDAYFNAVTLHSDLGQYQEALTLIRPLHDRIPGHKRLNYMLGHLYHRVGNLAEAHAFFNRVLTEVSREETPGQLKADALSGLASVFDDSGNLAGAEFLFREAIHLNKAPYLYYNLARTLRRAKKLEDAVKEISFAVDREPGNYTFVLSLAETLNDAEHLGKAFEAYKLAAELRPNEPFPRFMMAHTAYRQRLWTTALSEYRRLLDSSADSEVHGAVHKGIGNLYHEKGDYPPALEAYNRAAGILLRDSALFYNMARTYFQMGNLDECFAALKKSIEFNPKSSEAYTLLGTYYFKKGVMQKAYESFAEAVKLNPENLEAYYNRDVARKYQ
ncbi:MAG: hypothetical protein A3G34_00155 [Candidatus Lindowbacteria bacterium RIFCSPLOWO2_12_FULL_62_27]|nr:MAG: hypothetical protein A3G34_00155 [Candidatus Lindowbacteria bacterium RIFCSPLOWO2_12_FULL_62_27]OGH56697.1 MAG: hypothetical protein A3I06_07595 [Candidatus Lindowbacteria bacterium RIFCSPLOWO2_02_FULL_62_12]